MFVRGRFASPTRVSLFGWLCLITCESVAKPEAARKALTRDSPMIDLSTLEIAASGGNAETDPIKIFAGLTQRGNIEGLYGPQQEALTKWHTEHRAKSDVAYSINTGGGKTLVGLLTAQAIVNETRGKVIYACVTNQLVEQTVAQAEQCGIVVASYADSCWQNQELFDTAQSFCITNYHALFTGRSRFTGGNIRAVVFDDAHVAPAIIRECFTVKIPPEHSAWGPLMAVFRPYFENSQFFSLFNRFSKPNGTKDSGLLFVPAWFVIDNLKAIVIALEENQVMTEESRFAYPHLRCHLGYCCFFISHKGIDITPTVIPTHTLPYFQPGVRRIYMTATLPSRYECIKTFGVDRAEVIAPSGKAGAAQRLFVFARGDSKPDSNTSPYEETRTLSAKRKACIIVPSTAAAEKWLDIAELYASSRGHIAIKGFMSARAPKKLVVAALYDGIDLPGKSCNILVLDGVPRGSSMHDRFIEEALDVSSLKLSNTAIRITQSIGRIFRSNTDHGVVILSEVGIQSWLNDPFHSAFLPQLLQQQIRLGAGVRKLVDEKKVTYMELMQSVIDGDAGWDTFYNRELSKCRAESVPRQNKWGDKAARQEYDAFKELWLDRFEKAAALLLKLAEEVDVEESTLGAWFRHWAGAAIQLSGAQADPLYRQAANEKAVLGNPRSNPEILTSKLPAPCAQSRSAARHFDSEAVKKIEEVRKWLKGDGGKNATDHEQAIHDVGLFLGFRPSRPDRDHGKGPDVLWLLDDEKIAVGIEAKTQKENPKMYKKNATIGKLHNDRQWIEENAPKFAQQLVIVGPLVGIVKQANPPPNLRVAPLANFQSLADRLLFAAQYIATAQSDMSKDTAVQLAFEVYGLLWPKCLDSMDYRLASDLQTDVSE